MVAGNKLTDSMSDWITPAQAAKIWGVDQAQVTRRVQQGRLTLRVSNGRKYLFKQEVVDWVDLKKGNPNFIDHANGNCLDKDSWPAFLEIMNKIVETNGDVVFQPKFKGGKRSVEALVLDEGRWEKLVEKKIA